MPSNTYKDLTLGASGTAYVAPADGWYWAQSVANLSTSTSSSSYSQLANTTSGTAFTMHTFQNSNTYTTILPVKKGDVVSFSYRNINTSSAAFYFRFYYAVGSESEAS